ncbi:MAG: DUF3592 domain-containing protein [Cyclobacteriaceae bacterium]|jgi:hypothetical protein
MYQPPRQVKFKTKFELLKHRPFQSLIGIYLIVFTLLFITVSFILTNSLKDKTVPDVDYDEVNKEGKPTSGIITNIDVKENITDNGEHPAIITYKYNADGQEIESRYQILAPDKVTQMEIGEEIEIKYLGEQSILAEFEPYSFPAELFALFPLPFLFIGLVLLIPSFTKFKKDLKLYQFGDVYDAELVLMTPKSGFLPWNFAQRILVNYRYRTSTGQSILDESLTTDFSIINEKKQGDTIKVFVSRQDESKSTLAPKIESIRNDWKIEGLDK